MRYQIRGIPTLLLFKGGKVVEQRVGAMPKPELVKMIAPHVPVPPLRLRPRGCIRGTLASASFRCLARVLPLHRPCQWRCPRVSLDSSRVLSLCDLTTRIADRKDRRWRETTPDDRADPRATPMILAQWFAERGMCWPATIRPLRYARDPRRGGSGSPSSLQASEALPVKHRPGNWNRAD